ncbi:MAG: sigma-70 family RNA polymerase sigma factor [Bacteroidales bacterium]|nr:sigma-70 family RNA polymerase sigma factor [Bacteroidales bacterium]
MDKEQLFLDILNKYKTYISFRCFMWSRGNKERGKDSYQDVLSMIWALLPTFNLHVSEKEKFLWIKNITLRTLRTKYGKSNVQYVFDYTEAEQINLKDSSIDAEELIQELKYYLNEKEKILLEYILCGFDNNEIAVLTDTDANTIGARKHRMIKKMRDIYNNIYLNKKRYERQQTENSGASKK